MSLNNNFQKENEITFNKTNRYISKVIKKIKLGKEKEIIKEEIIKEFKDKRP